MVTMIATEKSIKMPNVSFKCLVLKSYQLWTLHDKRLTHLTHLHSDWLTVCKKDFAEL